jgi:C4-dicarboxylate-specific signal transduction histidine kinase
MKDDAVVFGRFRLVVAEGLLEQYGAGLVKPGVRALYTGHALCGGRDNALGTALAVEGGAFAKGVKVTGELGDLRNKLKQVEAALHEAERRNLDAQMQLAHANRIATMGQLAASIVHEVNQPIGATLLNAETALRRLAASPPNLDGARRSIDRIITDGKRVTDIIGIIRDLAKKAPARKEDLEINEAISDTMRLTQAAVSDLGVLVRMQLSEGLPSILGDRVQLQQVILNLIMNAIEAMSEVREGARELLISTSCEVEFGPLLVTVSDLGPGLPKADAERIFDPFYTTKANGLGMGLSICRSIVEGHGGRLWATPNEPCGAVFRVTLPVGKKALENAE